MKKEFETDLKGNLLVREEEIKVIYEGPSFEGKMELSDLTSQLKSTEIIIRGIVSELYKERKIPRPEETKIYLKLKTGSFQEIISVIFNNPTTATIIGGTIVLLLDRLLGKRNKNPSPIKIENLTNDYTFIKNFNQIVTPIINKQDRINIISSNPKIHISVSFNDKRKIKNKLKELKNQIATEIFHEQFFGYLSQLDIDKGKYAFTLEGSDRHIPVIFKKNPSLKEIKEILGFRLQIDAIATYEEKELKNLEIEKYQIKKRKINPKYQKYKDKEGNWKHIHARVGEKKYHYEHIPKDFVIHHIDFDKNNNQRFNLILLHKKDHKRVHKGTLKIESVQLSKEKEKKEEGDELEAVVEKKGEVRLRKR